MSENLGAFVEITHEKLGREGLFLLGAREALDRHVDKLDWIIRQEQNPIALECLQRYREFIAKDRDGVAVALTRVALKDKSGVITELKHD